MSENKLNKSHSAQKLQYNYLRGEKKKAKTTEMTAVIFLLKYVKPKTRLCVKWEFIGADVCCLTDVGIHKLSSQDYCDLLSFIPKYCNI